MITLTSASLRGWNITRSERGKKVRERERERERETEREGKGEERAGRSTVGCGCQCGGKQGPEKERSPAHPGDNCSQEEEEGEVVKRRKKRDMRFSVSFSTESDTSGGHDDHSPNKHRPNMEGRQRKRGGMRGWNLTPADR